jgi:hypothetical protein
MAKQSLELIEAMYGIIEAAQPITGRGVGYKLFTAGLIPSMSDMKRVYRLLKEARERDIIPWEWIVDESRELERVSCWDNPKQYTRCVINGYRRDYWNQQSRRVEVEGHHTRRPPACARRIRRRLPGHARVRQRYRSLQHCTG